MLQAAPEEQQLPVLLLAAVHSLVLAEPDLPLADWYPTVRDEPRRDDVVPAFVRCCHDREADLRRIIATRSTQTNEVGRCALFLPVLTELAHERGPLALIDVGTSAGLNLRLDRYAYDYDGCRVGDPSPVMLACGVRGAASLPQDVPPIGARIGIDREPIAIDDDEQTRWLMACVWPDQHDRFQRLRAAIEIARDVPVSVIRGDAVDSLAGAVDAAAGSGHPVVLTSWVLNYLPAMARTEFVERLDSIGAGRDLSWIALESPGLCPGVPFPDEIAASFRTHLVTGRWRDGRRTLRHVAECHPHGYWMHWTPEQRRPDTG